MIVADTNLIVYFFTSTPFTEAVEAVRRKDNVWIAPPLWRSEFLNVLSLYLRMKTFSLASGLRLMEKAEAVMSPGERVVSSAHVLALAESTQLSAYDCEFVALAQAERVPLVTADAKILKTFPGIALSFDQFVGRG